MKLNTTEKKETSKKKRKPRIKAEDRHTDPIKKKQAEAGRKSNLRGKSGERAVIKKIAKWWDPDDKFEWVRSPNSGGSELKGGFDLAGDLATTCDDFSFHIEMKKDQRWEKLDKGITVGEKWGLNGYIEQAVDDCPSHRYPIVIFMMPGPSQPKFVAIWDPDFKIPIFNMLLQAKNIYWAEFFQPMVVGFRCVRILKLDDFLSVSPKDMRTIFGRD